MFLLLDCCKSLKRIKKIGCVGSCGYAPASVKSLLKISQTELSLKTNSVQKSGGSYEDVQAHSIRCLVDAAVS